jgi:hypothetical protein
MAQDNIKKIFCCYNVDEYLYSIKARNLSIRSLAINIQFAVCDYMPVSVCVCVRARREALTIMQQDRQCTYNVTLRWVRATTVAVEKQ